MESKVTVNRSAPTAKIVPILIYDDVGKAIDWLCGAFGFTERLRFATADGKVRHAQLDYSDGCIMLGMQGAEFRVPRAHEVNQYVLVHVDEIDQHFERAKNFGANIVESLADKPFGERQYTVLDPGGHRWTFSKHVADVAPESWGAKPAGSR